MRRGDLWRAKYQADTVLKQRLLTILVWQARARDEHTETRDDGRHLERWADPDALAALPATFVAFDARDQWRGLFGTLDLYTRLAHQTAERLTLPVSHSEPAVLAWLHNLRPAA